MGHSFLHCLLTPKVLGWAALILAVLGVIFLFGYLGKEFLDYLSTHPIFVTAPYHD